ncbi:hypothetical protein PG987_002206 [Apiospora arundinis]
MPAGSALSDRRTGSNFLNLSQPIHNRRILLVLITPNYLHRNTSSRLLTIIIRSLALESCLLTRCKPSLTSAGIMSKTDLRHLQYRTTIDIPLRQRMSRHHITSTPETLL